MAFQTKVAEQENPVEKMCSACTKGYAMFTFRHLHGFPAHDRAHDNERHLCLRCYERERARTELDKHFQDILEAHPEWERRDDETRSDYAARMIAECKAMRGPVIISKPAVPDTPADERYFE